MLRTRDPYLAFARAVRLLTPRSSPLPASIRSRRSPPSAKIGDNVSIAAFVSIEDEVTIGRDVVIGPHVSIGDGATVGDGCRLHAGVSIRQRSVLGRRVVVQDGVVIGGDGFGFAKREDGTYEKIPQPGIVVIEDDVEIGANSTIDRPAVGETRIRPGRRLTISCRSAHGVRVGRNTMLCGQVGIAGSSVIGDDVVLAGQVGVAGHLTIGDRGHRDSADGHPQFGRGRHAHLRLSRHSEPRLAEVLRRVPQAARAQEGGGRARGQRRGTRTPPRRAIVGPDSDIEPIFND